MNWLRTAAAAVMLCAAAATAHTVVLYSSIDADQAYRAYGLSRAFDDAFIARDLMPGALWREAIAAKICSADTVIVMWSSSAAASAEVEKELSIASFCERKMIPVLLDSWPLPMELKHIHAVDWRDKRGN